MKSKRSQKVPWIIIGIIAVAVMAAAAALRPWKKPPADLTSAFFAVTRRNLPITVLESGSVKALKKLEIKCEVEGETTVLSLIPEGTFLTEEDVEGKRVLVELDSSRIRDRLTQQEITLQSAQASYIQAKESYDIQVNQNESNIKAGELDAKFSRMDLDKYLGEELAAELVEHPTSFVDLSLGDELAAELVEHPTSFVDLVSDERLWGEARQKLRKLGSDIDFADEEVKRAVDKFDWTKTLRLKEFVSRNEEEADRLALERRTVEHEQAQTERDIFVRYEFPKEVEQRLADHYEAVKELERINARARSELAQAQAERSSKEAAYRLQKESYDKLREQLEASVIYATQPGLVVYATSGNPWHRQPPLEEGATVRERQVLINIPDTSQMAAEIKVHEASYDKVKEGQRAKIAFDAFPELNLEGHVYKVAILPDAQHRWLNPDLKVYNTDVIIHGEHKVLKPGLSAKVEILIDELADVLAVPIQSVVPEGEQRLCYVFTGNGREKRVVETGEANDQFIEIKSGLNVGEKVMLNPPRYGEEAGGPDFLQQEGEDGEEPGTRDEDTPAQQQGEKRDAEQEEKEDTEDDAQEQLMQRPQDMSAEKLEEMRKRFEKMSPEEQRELREKLLKEGRARPPGAAGGADSRRGRGGAGRPARGTPE